MLQCPFHREVVRGRGQPQRRLHARHVVVHGGQVRFDVLQIIHFLLSSSRSLVRSLSCWLVEQGSLRSCGSGRVWPGATKGTAGTVGLWALAAVAGNRRVGGSQDGQQTMEIGTGRFVARGRERHGPQALAVRAVPIASGRCGGVFFVCTVPGSSFDFRAVGFLCSFHGGGGRGWLKLLLCK